MRFANRTQAGEALASDIVSTRSAAQVVIGLARGGVVVAAPIATSLACPLDVLVVKKIPSPLNPELAIGALAPDGIDVVYWRIAHRTAADEAYIKSQKAILNEVIKQKILLYRKGRKPLDMKGKRVVVVDDGAATGATLETAIRWLKTKKAGTITVALPVAPPEVIARITPEVSRVFVLETPTDLEAVGEYYQDFPQVEDDEVVKLLNPDQ